MTLKDLSTGSQETFPRAELAERLGAGGSDERLARQPAGALRASDAGQDGPPQGLGRAAPRPRRADLPDDAGPQRTASRWSSTGSAALRRPSRPRPRRAARTSSRSRARSCCAPRASATRSCRPGRSRSSRRGLEFLARSETPPFVVEDRTNATEELRLEYRYLDLRRPAMQKNFVLRDEIAFRVRRVLHERGFLEVETPMLTRSTPEGARDFLVPSRVHRGPVVRAAAVAPALQADPDDLGLREVLPDRALLPRRGPAGRPPVRVHADRPRDVVSDRGGRLRHGRGLPRRGVRGGRDRRGAAVPAADVPRGDGDLRHRPAGPALRPSALRPSAAAPGSGFAPFEKALAVGRDRAGLRVAGRRGLLAQAAGRADREAPASTARAVCSGSSDREARSTSPAKKALSDGDRSRRSWRQPASPTATCS